MLRIGDDLDMRVLCVLILQALVVVHQRTADRPLPVTAVSEDHPVDTEAAILVVLPHEYVEVRRLRISCCQQLSCGLGLGRGSSAAAGGDSMFCKTVLVENNELICVNESQPPVAEPADNKRGIAD